MGVMVCIVVNSRRSLSMEQLVFTVPVIDVGGLHSSVQFLKNSVASSGHLDF